LSFQNFKILIPYGGFSAPDDISRQNVPKSDGIILLKIVFLRNFMTEKGGVKYRHISVVDSRNH
jgi:hypothetical protein